MKRLRRIVAVLAFFLLACGALVFAGCNGQGDDEDPPLNILDSAKHSLVEVSCALQQGSGFIFNLDDGVESGADSEQLGTPGGSALIATNFHVIQDAISTVGSEMVSGCEVFVRFFGESKGVTATVVGFNRYYDIAVLRAEGAPQTAVALTDWGNAEVGERIYSLAYNGTYSAFDGMVSNAARFINIADFNTNLYLTETTAPSPKGSSGGPCITEDGRLVGLNAYNAVEGGVLQGLSYKIPASVLRAVVDRIVGASKTPYELNFKGDFQIFGKGAIAITCFDNKTFETLPLPKGLVVTYSEYIPFTEGSIIRKVNGIDADILTLIAELIKTGKDTELR